MILETFEKSVEDATETTVRMMYLLGEEHVGWPYGHVLVDMSPTAILCHMQVYSGTKSNLVSMKEDIKFLLSKLAKEKYGYDFVVTYTPNEKYVEFIMKDNFTIKEKRPYGPGTIMVIDTHLKAA